MLLKTTVKFCKLVNGGEGEGSKGRLILIFSNLFVGVVIREG